MALALMHVYVVLKTDIIRFGLDGFSLNARLRAKQPTGF
jgi:hypothetical protein